jgi:hypothetical protein
MAETTCARGRIDQTQQMVERERERERDHNAWRKHETEREREREQTRQGKAPRGATRGKRWDRKKAYVVVVGREGGDGGRVVGSGRMRAVAKGAGQSGVVTLLLPRTRAQEPSPGGKKTNPRYD